MLSRRAILGSTTIAPVLVANDRTLRFMPYSASGDKPPVPSELFTDACVGDVTLSPDESIEAEAHVKEYRDLFA